MLRICGLIVVSLLFVSACNNSSKANVTANQPVSVEMKDLSSIIAKAPVLWTSFYQDPEGPPMNWRLPLQPSEFDSLTKAQKMQIGGWIAPGDARIEMLATFSTYREYERDQGHAPSSGADIVDWILSNNPNITYHDLLVSASDSLPGWFYELTNPVTGKLYASFDGTVPEPGGIKIRKLTDANDAQRAFAGRPGSDLYGKPPYTLGYEVILFDTNPTKVLDTAVVLLAAKSGES